MPFGTLLVGLGHLFPIIVGCQAENIGQRIEPVFFLFDALDLVFLDTVCTASRAVRLDQLAQERLTGTAAGTRAGALADRLDAALAFTNSGRNSSLADRMT